VIDAYLKDHIAQCEQRGLTPKYYVLVGPHEPGSNKRAGAGVQDIEDESFDGVPQPQSNDGVAAVSEECKAYYILNAYDDLHALYVVIRDCTYDAMSMGNVVPPGSYAYPITSFLDELLSSGADLMNAVDLFRTYDISPYEIIPYDNQEVVEIQTKPAKSS
jgi:hypothetical protein